MGCPSISDPARTKDRMSAKAVLASAVNCLALIEFLSFDADSVRKSWSTEGISLSAESIAFEGLVIGR